MGEVRVNEADYEQQLAELRHLRGKVDELQAEGTKLQLRNQQLAHQAQVAQHWLDEFQGQAAAASLRGQELVGGVQRAVAMLRSGYPNMTPREEEAAAALTMTLTTAAGIKG